MRKFAAQSRGIRRANGWQSLRRMVNPAVINILQPFQPWIIAAGVVKTGTLVEADGGAVGVMDAKDDFVAVGKMRAYKRVKTGRRKRGAGVYGAF